MKLLVIGDTHFKENLSYADYISDRREGERKQVLDTIVDASLDCEGVVFMGDCFDKVSNPHHVIRAFTEFVERFYGKQVYILAGNHEKRADGSSAIDYLREIKNLNWHIIADRVDGIVPLVDHRQVGLLFCPYFYRQERGFETYDEGTKLLTKQLTTNAKMGFKILFAHHAISDTLTPGGQSTNLFPEIVLPKKELEDMFDLVIAGHIHKPKLYGKTLITGSVFTSEAGDTETFIWKLDTDTLNIESIKLPTRPIYRLENPALDYLEKLDPYSIVKVVLTDRTFQPEDYKTILKRFDAYLLLENYPNERKQLDVSDGAMMEFTVENLLGLYAKAKNVDETKLLMAWDLIK